MTALLWGLAWLLITVLSALANLRHIEAERERYRRLVKAFVQNERSLDALSRVYEESARRMETRDRERRQRLQAQAEQLIVLRTARGRNGRVEVARLYLTETDREFLRLRPSLWPAMAEACQDVAGRWFYRAMAMGV